MISVTDAIVKSLLESPTRTKSIKAPSLQSFIDACTASSDYERIGGIGIDATTKGMVTQVWAHIQKHPKAAEFSEKLAALYLKHATEHGEKVAIGSLIDRFWKMTK